MTKQYGFLTLIPLFLLCSCGVKEYITEKNHNQDAISPNAKKIWFFKGYRSRKYRLNKSQTASVVSVQGRYYRTIRPVNRDASGRWYHRFSLRQTVYRNSGDAVTAVNKMIASFYEQDQRFRGKQWGPLYILITGRIVYRLSSGFYLAGWINRRFRELCRKVLPSGIPEKGSVVTTRHRPGKGYFLLR